MKSNNLLWVVVIGSILAICLLGIYSTIITVSNNQSKTINIDIHDRENGICADMYKEGYDWGYGQVPLQISIWRMEGKSDDLIKELVWDWVKSSPNKN
jgi:hypothetical protein